MTRRQPTAPLPHTARTRGFTLLELVITLAIIGLLASAAMPLAQLVAKREKEAELRAALRDIRTALDAYRLAVRTGHIKQEVGASGYPPDLASLYSGVEDEAREDRTNMYFLRRIPRDPFYPDPSVPADQTWGVRSYQSTPADPQAGDDVFDIYSLSTATGLNGVPYREW